MTMWTTEESYITECFLQSFMWPVGMMEQKKYITCNCGWCWFYFLIFNFKFTKSQRKHFTVYVTMYLWMPPPQPKKKERSSRLTSCKYAHLHVCLNNNKKCEAKMDQCSKKTHKIQILNPFFGRFTPNFHDRFYRMNVCHHF